MDKIFEQKSEELMHLCGKFNVRRLEIFGSAAVESRFDQADSDLDFLVEFAPLQSGQYADTYFGLLESLESLFGKPVDLVMSTAIKNPYFLESVNLSRRVLYAA